MHLILKSFSILEFEDYVWNVYKSNGWTANFVVTHNTSSPTQKLFREWHSRANWTFEQWLKNLASYYAGMGWNGCPHLFVGYDRIGVVNDLAYPGTHSPSWNKFSLGVETVGEFENEPFNDGVKANLVAALAILHSRFGLNPSDYKLGVRGLHFHKEDKNTTHTSCPGKNLVKKDLVKSVVDYMNLDSPSSHPHISEAVHTADSFSLTDFELLDARWLQTNLNIKTNAGLEVDGKIGDKTKKAVVNFQKLVRLNNIDGIAGPVTRKALKNYNVSILK